jgi:hypothetical protein
MPEARHGLKSVSLWLMVGLVMVGCSSTPQRGGNTGGKGGDDPDPDPETEVDAAAVKKPDAKVVDPEPEEKQDAAVVSLPPDAAAPATKLDAQAMATPDAAPSMPEAGGAPGAVTFTMLWTEIFSQPMSNPSSCAGAACHNPGKKDMVDMSSKAAAYTSLTRAGGPVVKGNPTTSKLYQRITSKNVAQRMPLTRPALSVALTDKVKAWIAAGAMND